ncbi:MAG: hypothetical protein IT242_09395 [Bacteroidia bacterium]|nr:hypothetical protein [Bacteroidia bacterium]
MKKYMVISRLPSNPDNRFVSLIPEQRRVVREMLMKGLLSSYALSAEKDTIWMIVEAETELQVITLLADFPLRSYMKNDIRELLFHNAITRLSLKPSLN